MLVDLKAVNKITQHSMFPSYYLLYVPYLSIYKPRDICRHAGFMSAIRILYHVFMGSRTVFTVSKSIFDNHVLIKYLRCFMLSS